jgi:hypothetical protein
VLSLSFCGITILPAIWLFATPRFLLPIWTDAVLTGIFWSGINLSLFNIIFSLSEEKSLKESYFATFATVTGLCAFGASILGGLLAQALAPLRIPFGGQILINYHVLFATTTIFRLVGIFWLVKVKEKDAYGTRATLRYLRDYALRRIARLQPNFQRQQRPAPEQRI